MLAPISLLTTTAGSVCLSTHLRFRRSAPLASPSGFRGLNPYGSILLRGERVVSQYTSPRIRGGPVAHHVPVREHRILAMMD